MHKFVKGKKITPEAELVLLVARWIVNGQGVPEIKNLLAQSAPKWMYFNDLLAYHEISPFVYSCFKDCLPFVPSIQIELYKKHQHLSLIYLANLEKEFAKIADIFQNNKIEFVPIKGTAFLIDKMYADNTSLRPMADIDILIKERNLEQIERVLKDLEYEKELDGKKEEYWRKKNYHLSFAKNDGKRLYRFETHWLLDYPRKAPLLSSLWDRTRKCKFGNREISLLSHEDTLFCLALHLRRFGNVLSLKSACDFALALNRCKQLDWDYILKEAKSSRVCVCLCFRLIQASLLFDAEIPADVYKNLSMPNFKMRLIQNFILQDTFFEQPCLDDRSDNRANLVYLKNHFLVYDNFLEPLKMIINIPHEQFAKFFSFPVYSLRTKLLHRLCFFYFLFIFFVLIVKTGMRRIIKWKKEYARLELAIF